MLTVDPFGQLNAVRTILSHQSAIADSHSMPIRTCESLSCASGPGLNFLSHDLSWGTKGSDTVQAVDLGAIQGVGRHVQVELVSAQQDIDIAYQDALDNIRLKRARVDADELPPKKDASEQQQKDTYVSRRLA